MPPVTMMTSRKMEGSDCNNDNNLHGPPYDAVVVCGGGGGSDGGGDDDDAVVSNGDVADHRGLMGTPVTSESLIEDSIGCGPFQGLIIVLVTVLTKVPTASTFMFMAFGNYNPGWRCLDRNHNNNTYSNGTVFGNVTSDPDPEFITSGRCETFDTCKNIQFNPDSSTIVTEWGLLCGQAWIASLIISLQMGGALIGSVVAGQLGDSLGRRTVVYGCVAAMGILNLGATFSPTWQVFAVFRFLSGAAASSLLATYYVLTNEFIPQKWRGPNSAIPAWNVGTIIFSVIAYFVRDWKILHLSIVAMSVLCFLPVFWVPESLRWLAVKKKRKKIRNVVAKMAKLNKKPIPSNEALNAIVANAASEEGKEEEKEEKITTTTTTGKMSKKPKYRVYHLLHRSIRKVTIVISLVWMCVSVIYYAISFGVKNLYGDFYLNLILLFALEIPFAIFPSFVPNLLGRIKGSLVFIAASAACLLTCAGLEFWGRGLNNKMGVATASSIIILLTKVSLNSGWCIQIMQTTELYPTVVRGLGVGWACLMARVGGILAPLLIPDDPSYLPSSYLAMAVLTLVVCGGITLLPETKGRPLRDNLDDKNDDNDDDDDNYHQEEGGKDHGNDDDLDKT